MYRISIDSSLCNGYGVCEALAPDVFELGDDDELRWQEEVDDSRREALEEAERMVERSPTA